MSSQTNNVVLTLLYEDETTRNYTLEGVAAADLSNVKSKILAINENVNNEYEYFYQTFVSADGAPFTRIDGAKIVIIEEEVIYSG
ncbi:MAG: hypothetical protein II857_00905 [Selenomonadaceae bacterium]|nr:hypothetical protein [Selenomonadaceae bacterium]